MLSLFELFDNTLNLNISLGIKFGILLNGNSSSHQAKLIPQLEAHLKDCLRDMTGLEEVDGRNSPDGEEPEGRLHGVFEIIGHIGDVFVRRFASA
jgi:hypothetical protein